MRVALVHDDLVHWGGAERVLEGICEIFPEAPIFTSVYDNSNKELYNRFGSKKIITSFLQKIPGWRNLYKTLMPFYPIAFEQFDFSDFDLVISQTTRFAKSIITKPQTKHICYCHTPPRFLWHFSGDKSPILLEPLMSKLRIYDQISSKRVDFFIAGSKNAKIRIKDTYKQDSRVVYPYIDLERFNNIESFNSNYFVMIARDSKYKKIDLAVSACQKLGVELKVISGGFLDEMVVRILAGCRALIVPGIEDFGLSAIEAQALGKPVIALKAGGNLETVIDNKTGILFDKQDLESLSGAIKRLDSKKIKAEDCKKNAQRFSKENFQRAFKQTIAAVVYT